MGKAPNPISLGIPSVIRMLERVYLFLSHSQLGIGQDCWLCLDHKPSYYTGNETDQTINSTSNPNSCKWDQPELTVGTSKGRVYAPEIVPPSRSCQQIWTLKILELIHPGRVEHLLTACTGGEPTLLCLHACHTTGVHL